MTKIADFWENTSKKTGDKYLSGKGIPVMVNLEGKKLMMFANEKKHEKAPDFSLFIADPDDKKPEYEKGSFLDNANNEPLPTPSTGDIPF